MTQHEVNFRVENYVAALLFIVFFGALAAHLESKRDAENAAQARRAAGQARAAAQPDTWARLDQKGRDLVAFDRIRK